MPYKSRLSLDLSKSVLIPYIVLQGFSARFIFSSACSFLVPILPIDSGRYGSREMRAIFTDERRLQYQLDFEAAVSKVQARLKMVPEDAAKEIRNVAKSGRITLQRVAELE